MPDTIGHIANIAKGYAIAIGVGYAIWYFRKLRLRTVAWREVDHQAKAQNLWSTFLRTKLDFAEQNGHPTASEQQERDIDFVAYLLSVGDEILIIDPTDKWRATLREELARHKPILTDDKFKNRLTDQHSPELNALIEAAIKAD